MEGNFLTFDSSAVWATVANLYNAVPVTREHRTTLTSRQQLGQGQPLSILCHYYAVIYVFFCASSCQECYGESKNSQSERNINYKGNGIYLAFPATLSMEIQDSAELLGESTTVWICFYFFPKMKKC